MPDITIDPGDVLFVDYHVENTGTGAGQQDVRLVRNSTQEDMDADIQLDPSSSTTGTLFWDTDGVDAGTYTVLVESDTDADSIQVEIESTIPDSAIHQYLFDEGSGTTLNDNIGSVAGSISGASWESDSSLEGGFGLFYDGVDDYTNYTIDFSQFSEWAIGITINSPNPDETSAGPFYISEEDSFGEMRSEYNFGGNGEIRFIATDGSDDNTVVGATDLRDGNNHRVFCGLRENDEIALYIDNSLEGTESYGTMGPVGDQLYNMHHARLGHYQTGTTDHMIVYDDWDASVVEDDFDAQPWS